MKTHLSHHGSFLGTLLLHGLRAHHSAATGYNAAGELPDLSGNPLANLSPATTYGPQIIPVQGSPALVFTGQEWFGSPSFRAAQPCTLYVSLCANGVSGGRLLNGLSNGPNIDMRSDGNGYNLWAGSLVQRHVGTVVGAHVVAATFDDGNTHFYLDGVEVTSGGGAYAGRADFDGLGLGGNGVNDYFRGAIYEDLVFEGAHGPTEIQLVSAHLRR